MEWQLLEDIKVRYKSILNDNLVGIYVHGSIAMNCFNWNTSDIDFIVVINEKLTLIEKELLIKVLLDLDPQAPCKGFEMSVVLKQYCESFIYPTPYELHFSNAHKINYQQNIQNYCLQLQGTDMDLAAHFTIIYHKGITLCGLDKAEVFLKVPEMYYLDSIIQDVLDVKAYLLNNPVYYLLNLCRVIAYKKEKLILSKKEGALWMLGKYKHPLIQLALNVYEDKEVFKYDAGELRKLVEEMVKEL